ncbi:hypothetical protein AKJ49_02230, partial [candidate division MSBL1 archaeon SCGC-AAA382A03]
PLVRVKHYCVLFCKHPFPPVLPFDPLPGLIVVTLTFANEEEKEKIEKEHPEEVIAKLQTDKKKGILYDSVYSKEFRETLLSLLIKEEKRRGEKGELVASLGKKHEKLHIDKTSHRQFALTSWLYVCSSR